MTQFYIITVFLAARYVNICNIDDFRLFVMFYCWLRRLWFYFLGTPIFFIWLVHMNVHLHGLFWLLLRLILLWLFLRLILFWLFLRLIFFWLVIEDLISYVTRYLFSLPSGRVFDRFSEMMLILFISMMNVSHLMSTLFFLLFHNHKIMLSFWLFGVHFLFTSFSQFFCAL